MHLPNPTCRRARNREAARRSRQRKSERINQLYKDIRSLQQENVVLLKCLEQVTCKAIACKAAQVDMRQELHALAVGGSVPAPGLDLTMPSLADDLPMLEAEHDASVSALAGPSHEGHFRPRGPMFGGMVPALEDLDKLQAEEHGQLTARGGSLSARAAVAEHIAMLSRDNSPRDEDEAVAGQAGKPGTAGQTDQQQQQQQQQVPIMPSSMVNIDQLFGYK